MQAGKATIEIEHPGEVRVHGEIIAHSAAEAEVFREIADQLNSDGVVGYGFAFKDGTLTFHCVASTKPHLNADIEKMKAAALPQADGDPAPAAPEAEVDDQELDAKVLAYLGGDQEQFDALTEDQFQEIAALIEAVESKSPIVSDDSA